MKPINTKGLDDLITSFITEGDNSLSIWETTVILKMPNVSITIPKEIFNTLITWYITDQGEKCSACNGRGKVIGFPQDSNCQECKGKGTI